MKQDTCPTCGQPLPQAKGRRICADCGSQIRKRERWHIGRDGKLHHNNCQQTASMPEVRQQELITA
jgi:uncharacterized Zn finger protein (UPF0148 family)